ncbi:galactosyltransferase-related protein [Microcoleus sp. LEGE 07076]|uniref:galactosyltransferase-related protein n=1 Tax=Microcoleus sp. LEGE 07076 TaxID=915322 RepID=UPI0030DDB987
MNEIQLSLIITYRQRQQHLKTQLAWWKTQASASLSSVCEIILIELDRVPSPWILPEIINLPINYNYLPCAGTFHKTKALNLGLSLSRGEWVAAFDVDLIPYQDTLYRHLKMAQISSQMLVTGYRMMCDTSRLDFAQNSAILEEKFKVAPEDMPTALFKHLTRRERFGVSPIFQRQRLIEIGGWDETFIGWGAEDQDIVERYLGEDRYFCRSPELIYLHLAHEPDANWSESHWTDQNRQHYYTKRQSPDLRFEI